MKKIFISQPMKGLTDEEILNKRQEIMKNAEKVNSLSLQEINEWWHLLQDDFKNLDLNYKSYLREFYSADTMTLMKLQLLSDLVHIQDSE